MSSLLQLFSEHFKDLNEAEKRVKARDGSYKDLDLRALYTSVSDLKNIFSKLSGSFCDLGCGTGMSSVLYGILFPSRESFGIEFEASRLNVGLDFVSMNRVQNVALTCEDLLHSDIPYADNFFLYFPTGHVLDRILSVLSERQNIRLIVIESHGDLIHRIEQENWLTLIEEIPLKVQRHYPMARVYKHNNCKRADDLWPFEITFKDQYLLIEENDETSIASSFGMEWIGGQKFNLVHPPRTVSMKDVRKIITSPSELQVKFLGLALEIRKKGTVKIQTRSSSFDGFIRKIIITPSFRVEISSGEKVEWSDIISITQGSDLCYAILP